MPELPEVETVKNELEPHVIGQRINDVTILWPGMVRQPSPEEFRSRLIGQKITALSRRGKYLFFHLSNGEALVIHLKMSGSLWTDPPDRFVRAIIHLDGGKAIYFRDPRKFGMLKLVEEAKSILSELGPDALAPEFTSGLLASVLSKRTAPIKALLCDQSLIAGIGNMYADEALFAARIHPLRQGKSLTKNEIKRLYDAIQHVLQAGIKNKGASTETYFRPGGEKGTAHLEFQVAHRRGEKCPVCGTPLLRIAIRNRGTYFCPKCQPVKP